MTPCTRSAPWSPSGAVMGSPPSRWCALGPGSGLLSVAIGLPGVECAAACDLYDGRRELAREIAGDKLPTTRRYQELLDNKDIDAIVQLYAPEPVFLANSGERWSGIDEIRTNFAMGLSEFTPKLTLQSKRSADSGTLAYDSGTYDEIITPAKGKAAAYVRGNYLFVFQRQKNGEWKILEQTFTQYDPSKL